MTEIRLGIIGCGRRATAYPLSIGAVKKARVTALCDIFPDRVSIVKKLFNDEHIREFTDHRKMLSEGGFDAVFVITEPEYQAQLSVEVMEAGYHVFSDVPMSFSAEECENVVRAAEKTGKIYYLGEQVRHSDLVCYWKHLVSQGMLGSILFAEGHYIHAMSGERFWKDSRTGELLDWEAASGNPYRQKTRLWTMPHPILYGPHELSPLLKILDDRIINVSCMSTGSPGKRFSEVPFHGQFEEFPVSDMEVAMMQTEKGAIIRFAANFSTPVSINHWYHIMGTKGELETKRGSDEHGHSYFYDKPVMNASEYRKPRIAEEWFEMAGKAPFEKAKLIGRDSQKSAEATGHGGLDYYPVADFISSLQNNSKPDIDIYQAADTALPCIYAARSAEFGGKKLNVPDLRKETINNG